MLVPDDPKGLALLGEPYVGMGRWPEAVAPLSRAHELVPDDIVVSFFLGFAHQLVGDYVPAISIFRALLASHSDALRVEYHLGACLYALGHVAEALPYLQRAAVAVPGDIGRQFLVGLAQTKTGELDAACEAFSRAVTRLPLPSDANALRRLERHRAECERYRAQHSVDPTAPVNFLRGSIDWPAAARAFETHAPHMVVVDDFLDPETLTWIQDFVNRGAWDSGTTSGDEIHASLGEGFFAKPLLGLAHAITRDANALVGLLPLQSLWMYKYFSNNRERTPHADAGRLSVNIWITPDAHNRSEGTGGLRLWPILAERAYYAQNRDWQRDYVRSRLAVSDAPFEIIPYRCNRAIIFDSTLIHQTEEFDFDDTHGGRRANITLAYGSHHTVPV